MDVQRLSLYPLTLQAGPENLTTSSVATLLAISHGLEDAVIRHRLRGTFYAGFQRFSAFLPQVNRFARLAVRCGDVVVFGVPDAPTLAIPNVTYVELSPDAPLAREWFIVFDRPELAAALLTREIGATDDMLTTFGRGRYYQGVLSFDPALVTAAQTALARALARTASAKPDASAAPPAPYQTFLQIFSRSLEKRNRQLAALYQTLDRRAQSLERLNQVIKTLMSRVAWEEAASQSEATGRGGVEGEGMQSTAEAMLKQTTLTVLCSDVQGFTTLSATRPAQPLMQDLNHYLDILATTVYQNLGDVDKFLGDGMLAFFQRPAAALQAALEMQRRIAAFNAQQVARLRDPFPTRVSLATGPCLIARVGSRDRQEVTILGDTVNMASRLQALSQVGGVLLDETTYQACQPLEATAMSVKVRGKAGVQSVYQITPGVV